MSKIASTSGKGSVTSSVSPIPTLFKEYELVRVRQLIQSADALDGWGVNQRPPALGDVGTLLDILTALELRENMSWNTLAKTVFLFGWRTSSKMRLSVRKNANLAIDWTASTLRVPAQDQGDRRDMMDVWTFGQPFDAKCHYRS